MKRKVLGHITGSESETAVKFASQTRTDCGKTELGRAIGYEINSAFTLGHMSLDMSSDLRPNVKAL